RAAGVPWPPVVTLADPATPGDRHAAVGAASPLRAASDDDRQAVGELLGAERGSDLGLDAVLGEQLRHPRCVGQHICVTLVVTAPRAVVVADERRHVADEGGGSRTRVL